MYDAVLFDLDGTLVDSVDVHVAAWKKAMEDLGIKVGKEEERKYRQNVGKTLKDILTAIYGTIDDERLRKIQDLKNKYFIQFVESVKPIVPTEVLHRLREKYKLGIVTSTNRETARSILKYLDIENIFDVIITSEDVKTGKPSPEGILKAKKMLGAKRVLYIGDTEYDRIAAERAGVDFMEVGRFLREWKSLL